MSDLSVNTNNLQDEGLDAETVDLGTSNLETTPSVNLGTSSMQVGIGGPEGVGIASIEQTTTSTEDGGINEVTQTLTDGTTAVFQIRNGSKGSQGERGEKGDAGEDWIPTQQELASIAQSAAALVTVPTKTSELTNDSHFVDDVYVLRKTADMAAAIDDMRGEANGFASLDANGKVPSSQLPSSGGGGDTNVIEIVKVNGTALTPDSNKAVDVPVPTKVSDLNNDSGFITGYTETDPTVPSWAKQPTKPSYTASEVGALPSSTTIPTKTSDLTNDSGFITGYTETDPTVPSWAKQSTKPTYTASEVGALPASTTIPSALADLSDDSTHRVVTDTEKATWNAKGTYSKPSEGIPASDIASGVIPTVPTAVSSFSNDAHYVASTAITTIVSLTQAQYDALATKDANTLYIIPES